MKQLETTEKIIGDNAFYIRPFPAFVAANISGELASLLTPLLGSIAPIFFNDNSNDIMDMDIENVLPSVTTAFSSLSGEKFESLMKKLLIDNNNVSVEGVDTENKPMRLTYDLANEIFCGEVQDMYILCIEVIKLNFKGFFKKLGDQFGGLQKIMQTETPILANTDS